MKRLPGTLAALVLTSACSGIAVQTGTTVTPAATVTSTSVVTSSTAAQATSTTPPSGPPVAWIAPSGVPMAVTTVSGETIEVLTPCGESAAMTAGTPIYEVDVVIDPGHGGPVDTGAVAPTGLEEKDINLQVSLAVHDDLVGRGISSLLTRTGDYPVPIGIRTAYSNLAGARAVVSIHHNAPEAPASAIPGVEVFVQSETPESARLGGLIFDSSMTALSGFDVDWDRAPDAGVMTVLNGASEDAYGMVRLPEAPSALVELGYIANRAEAELFSDPEYVPTVAAALSDAVEAFLTTEETGAALVEGRVFTPQRGVGRDQCIEPDLEASLYPDVVEASATEDGGAYEFVVTMSSPYDSPERYADAWRVVGDDGVVYGVRELAHDHAGEQPFTRSLGGVEIADTVTSVRIQGRDQVYGWGGGAVELTLP